MDVRMLGDGRPFVMEIQNQRAEMPEKGFFQSVQDELKKVRLCGEFLQYLDNIHTS